MACWWDSARSTFNTVRAELGHQRPPLGLHGSVGVWVARGSRGDGPANQLSPVLALLVGHRHSHWFWFRWRRLLWLRLVWVVVWLSAVRWANRLRSGYPWLGARGGTGTTHGSSTGGVGRGLAEIDQDRAVIHIVGGGSGMFSQRGDHPVGEFLLVAGWAVDQVLAFAFQLGPRAEQHDLALVAGQRYVEAGVVQTGAVHEDAAVVVAAVRSQPLPAHGESFGFVGGEGVAQFESALGDVAGREHRTRQLGVVVGRGVVPRHLHAIRSDGGDDTPVAVEHHVAGDGLAVAVVAADQHQITHVEPGFSAAGQSAGGARTEFASRLPYGLGGLVDPGHLLVRRGQHHQAGGLGVRVRRTRPQT